jgi:hypothetical protein
LALVHDRRVRAVSSGRTAGSGLSCWPTRCLRHARTAKELTMNVSEPAASSPGRSSAAELRSRRDSPGVARAPRGETGPGGSSFSGDVPVRERVDECPRAPGRHQGRRPAPVGGLKAGVLRRTVALRRRAGDDRWPSNCPPSRHPAVRFGRRTEVSLRLGPKRDRHVQQGGPPSTTAERGSTARCRSFTSMQKGKT